MWFFQLHLFGSLTKCRFPLNYPSLNSPHARGMIIFDM
jgi:hypothetical protein